MMETQSEFLDLLRDRIDLKTTPFTDRNTRMLVFGEDNHLLVRLAEFGINNRMPEPLIPSLSFTGDNGHLLAIETTTYPHRVICATENISFSLSIADVDTLYRRDAPGSCCTSRLMTRIHRGPHTPVGVKNPIRRHFLGQATRR